APPELSCMLELDHVGLWITLHAHPGSTNAINGIIINHAYRIHCRSLFGYGLMWALAPCHWTCHVIYTWQFVFIMATPGLYWEAINKYNKEHPEAPFK